MSEAQVAWIDPQRCIGCTRCIDACVFDAIIGGTQKNHLVLPDLCTACNLCLPVCPVDCIVLQDDPVHPPRDRAYRVEAKQRVISRQERLAAVQHAQSRQLQQAHEQFQQADEQDRQEAITAALARARPPHSSPSDS